MADSRIIKKEEIEVNGRIVKMTDAAFQIASKHFGASKLKYKSKEVPFELRKAPKFDVIPAVQKSEPIKTEPIEVKVDLNTKDVNVTASPVSEKVTEARRPAGRKAIRK